MFSCAPHLYFSSFSGHSNKWTAVLDCAPLHVPITAMLGPYGHGTYTAMQYWQVNHVCGAGTRVSARELSTAGINFADCSLFNVTWFKGWYMISLCFVLVKLSLFHCILSANIDCKP